MKIGVLGTGMVGEAIASKLVELGHDVCMGSREPDNEKAVAWTHAAGDRTSHGGFAEAADHGDIVFNCTAGVASLEALKAAGADNLSGKVLIDLANPLDFSQGMPPRLKYCNEDSLGERIQTAFPKTRVVKSLNTMNCQVMVDPGRVPGEHNVFLCGEDEGAKAQVTGLLESFGWPEDRILDLGGIRNCRGTEMFLPLWLSLMGTIGDGNFNVAVLNP